MVFMSFSVVLGSLRKSGSKHTTLRIDRPLDSGWSSLVAAVLSADADTAGQTSPEYERPGRYNCHIKGAPAAGAGG